MNNKTIVLGFAIGQIGTLVPNQLQTIGHTHAIVLVHTRAVFVLA
jgi:hypothetical protein